MCMPASSADAVPRVPRQPGTCAERALQAERLLVYKHDAPGADAGCCGEVRRRVSHTAAPHSAPCAATIRVLLTGHARHNPATPTRENLQSSL